MVLSGGYVEAGDSGRHRVSAGDVIFHAACENHLDRFGSSRVEVLLLPIAQLWDGPVLASIDDPDAIVRLAERDANEAAAVLQTTMIERAPTAEDWPDVLAADLLCNPELSLADWSAEHQLHRGSLARGFRQQFGITPAGFRLVARARQALRKILHLSLCEAAADSGFADQAHMTRAVSRITGLSPARLRSQLVAAP